MPDLKELDALVDRLAERVEALIEERDTLRFELDRLLAYATERDEECVRVRQEMHRALEDAHNEVRWMRQGGDAIGLKLQDLNERLIRLVQDRRRGTRS